jgi:hypothetical protein
MVALKFFGHAYEDWFSVGVFVHELTFGVHISWKLDNDAVDWMLDNDAVDWMLDNDAVEWILNVWLPGP